MVCARYQLYIYISRKLEENGTYTQMGPAVGYMDTQCLIDLLCLIACHCVSLCVPVCPCVSLYVPVCTCMSLCATVCHCVPLCATTCLAVGERALLSDDSV